MRLSVKNRILLSYSVFHIAYMSFFPFESMYLAGLGYDRGMIAVLTTVTALVNFIVQFRIGKTVERIGSVAKTLKILLTGAALSAGLLYLFNKSAAAVILSVLPVTIMEFCVIGQLDAYTASAGAGDSSIHYSTMRAAASLTGALSASVFGIVYGKTDISLMFAVHIFLIILSIFCVMSLPEDTLVCKTGEAEALKTDAAPRREILAWIPFLLGGGLIFTGWRANIIYLPLILLKLGGNTTHQGIAMAVTSLSCMPVLLCYPALRKRLTVDMIIALGSIFMTLRLFMIPLIKTAEVMTAMQALEAISYGLVQPAIMEILTGSRDARIRVRIIAIWTGIQMALATIVSNAAVSVMGRYMELEYTFIGFSLASVAGMMILFAGLYKIKDGKEADT